jgi:hypothetical protein
VRSAHEAASFRNSAVALAEVRSFLIGVPSCLADALPHRLSLRYRTF